ncbi:MAG TPA: hypothetical protein VGF18_10355 [Candidatus Tumulicola sp.]|jgi:hypothetical protein
MVTALASSSLVGGGIATLSNAGLLGGSAHDLHEEGVAWFGIAAGVLLAGLAVCIVLFVRRSEWRAEYARAERLAMATGTLALTCGFVVLKEALETHCGGLNPFDPGSILVQHAPAVLLAYAIVAPIVGAIVRRCVGIAISAREIVIVTLARFLAIVRPTLPPSHSVRDFGARVTRRALLWSLGLLTFRAPPVPSMHWIDSTVT